MYPAIFRVYLYLTSLGTCVLSCNPTTPTLIPARCPVPSAALLPALKQHLPHCRMQNHPAPFQNTLILRIFKMSLLSASCPQERISIQSP